MCTEVNSAMGLQATAATKRKHELTFDSKDAKATAYTSNCPPPLKANKWSTNNNNYIDSLEEEQQQQQQKIYSTAAIATTTTTTDDDNNVVDAVVNEQSVAGEEVTMLEHIAPTNGTPSAENKKENNSNSINNSSNNSNSSSSSVGDEVTNRTTLAAKLPLPPTTQSSPAIVATTVNTLVATLLPVSAEVSATAPLPPTSLTPVPEDSIAKLEVVAAVPCEPWTGAVAVATAATTAEPVDCISKLQAVAVPSDPWGSIATRSTLATTLLSADELDDDDDDFEDDYEEEESIIPTYCPLRYHPFVAQTPTPGQSASAAATTPQQQAQRLGGGSGYTTSTTPGYVSRPNFYSEPFPQQNCSRTGSPQHMRVGGFNGGAPTPPPPQWQNGSNGFYENTITVNGYVGVAGQQQQQQQTIRCAENGKSYLDLGCSSSAIGVQTQISTQKLTTPNAPATVTPGFLTNTPPTHMHHPVHPAHPAGSVVDVRHHLKRCCDGRSIWCNTNKNCYKDIRLKIRNLSMFKLSRFRQVSEQSLYRSVLICNTLKRIDREIEADAKEMHQAAQQAQAQAQQHHQQAAAAAAAAAQYHQLQLASASQPNHQQQQYAQQQHAHHLPTQTPTQQQHPTPTTTHQIGHQQAQQEYTPVLNCARLTNMEYQQHFLQSPHYHTLQNERLDATNSNAPAYNLQKSPGNFVLHQLTGSSSSSNCDVAMSGVGNTTTTILHPYDHYPFRESQSGRATPFPTNCQPVITVHGSNGSAGTTHVNHTNSSIAIASSTTSPTTTPASTTTTTPPSNNNNSIPTHVVSLSNASTANANAAASSITACDSSDSGYADDDSTRSINWSSVLSLSSQSALDPLNNNDLFSILPPVPAIMNPATAVPVLPPPAVTSPASVSTDTSGNTSATTVAINGSFTAVQASSSAAASSACSSTTTATFTTLSTISSATHSLTSSYVSSLNSSNTPTVASTWEYSLLDMEFGLGSEFTELVPSSSCKLSSEDLFKSGLSNAVVATSRHFSTVHENELEHPAHIMVGS